MILHAQLPPSPPPLMAQITATDSSPPLNPTFGVPFISTSSSQTTPHHNYPSDVAPFYDPGLCMMMDGQGCGNKVGFAKMRKRGREEGVSTSPLINKKISNANVQIAANSSKDDSDNRWCTMCSSPGDDLAVAMLREQQELDLFILMQMEKLKAELEQRRRVYWHNLFHTIEQGMQRILRHKDEEIAKMSSKNTALEEKVKVLLMEGQIWKTVAQTNEAAATALRRDLELAQAREREGNNGEVADSASCCDGWNDSNLSCHGCHKKEISVLVLPCRHLCLCSECDTRLESCPLCMCAKSASIKVDMS